jgi:hypothetical protein
MKRERIDVNSKVQVDRRRVVQHLAVATAAGFSLLAVRDVQANPAWAQWKDLISFAPDQPALVAARNARGRPPLVFEVQRIENAAKSVINLDQFGVKIDTLPKVGGAKMTDVQLLNHVRKNLNSFFDANIAKLGAHLPDDQIEWDKSAMIGTIMLFHIYKWGLPIERGAVVISKSTPRSWVFSPIKIGAGIIGTHPVAGNREFGIRPDGSGHVLYVRAADRPFDVLPPESVVFAGADALWASFQARVAKFVNENGGKATAIASVIHRPEWTAVVDAGYFKP